MKRRWIGVVMALALAGLGTFALVRYIGGAEARAMQGQEAVDVLVVTAPVPAGTPAGSLGDRVAIETVPAKAQVPGSIVALTDLDGQVTAVDLVPGEQVIAARFVDPETFEESQELDVPEGLIEVTVSLSPERAVGGAIRPGDTVAVLSSFDPFDINGVFVDPVPTDAEEASTEPQADDNAKTPNSTHLTIHKVMVTNVQVETLPQEQETAVEGGSSGPALAPTGNLLVTLAVEPADAERLVFTAEFGYVWLGHEDEAASEDETRIQTRDTVYGVDIFGRVVAQ